MMCKNKKKIFTFLKSISVFTLPIALIPTFSLTHNFISSDTVNENALPEINTVIASGTNITGSETITSQPTANEILRLANAWCISQSKTLYLNDLLVELITTSGATIKVKNDANCYLANSTTSVTFTMVNQTLTNIIDIFPQSYLGSNILVGVLWTQNPPASPTLQTCITRLRTIRPDVSFNQLSFAFDSVTGFIKITAVTGSNKYTGASIVGISSNQYTSSKTLLTSIFPYTMSISSSSLSNLQYTGTINLPNIIAEIQNDFPAVLTNQINFEIINDRFVKATAKSDSVNYIGESYIGINTSTWDNLTPVSMTGPTTSGYTASASSEYQTQAGSHGPAWQAFNSNNNTWHYGPTTLDHRVNPYEWLKIKIPTAKAATTICWLARNDSPDATWQSPVTFDVEGSNNDSLWTNLLSVTNGRKGTQGQFSYYQLNNTSNYLYYRLKIKNTMWDGDANWNFNSNPKVNGNYPIITRLCIFGM